MCMCIYKYVCACVYKVIQGLKKRFNNLNNSFSVFLFTILFYFVSFAFNFSCD